MIRNFVAESVFCASSFLPRNPLSRFLWQNSRRQNSVILDKIAPQAFCVKKTISHFLSFRTELARVNFCQEFGLCRSSIFTQNFDRTVFVQKSFFRIAAFLKKIVVRAFLSQIPQNTILYFRTKSVGDDFMPKLLATRSRDLQETSGLPILYQNWLQRNSMIWHKIEAKAFRARSCFRSALHSVRKLALTGFVTEYGPANDRLLEQKWHLGIPSRMRAH